LPLNLRPWHRLDRPSADHRASDDPNGPLIRAQDDLDQRPTPERCFEAFHLQRTRFEMIAERKLGVAN